MFTGIVTDIGKIRVAGKNRRHPPCYRVPVRSRQYRNRRVDRLFGRLPDGCRESPRRRRTGMVCRRCVPGNARQDDTRRVARRQPDKSGTVLEDWRRTRRPSGQRSCGCDRGDSFDYAGRGLHAVPVPGAGRTGPLHRGQRVGLPWTAPRSRSTTSTVPSLASTSFPIRLT